MSNTCRLVLVLVALATLGTWSATSDALSTPRLIDHSSRDRFEASGDGSVVAVSGHKGNELRVYWPASHRRTVLRFPWVGFGGVRWGLTRDGRRVVYSMAADPPRRDKRVTVVYDLVTRKRRLYPGFFVGGVLDKAGRYIDAGRPGYCTTCATGVLDLKTGRFLRLPKAPAHYESFGVEVINGDGSLLIYRDASDHDDRCYLYSPASHVRVRINSTCRQQLVYVPSMTDDGSVFSMDNNLYDGITGRAVPMYPGAPARARLLAFDLRLSADGDSMLIGCGNWPVTATYFVLNRRTGTFGQLTATISSASWSGAVLTADGRTAIYQTKTGIYSVATADATPVTGGVPDQCKPTL